MACVTPFVPSFSSSPVVLNVNLRSLTNDRRSWISMTRFKLFLVLVRLSLVTGFLLFCFTLQSFLTLFSNLFLITCRIIFRTILNLSGNCFSNCRNLLKYRDNSDQLFTRVNFLLKLESTVSISLIGFLESSRISEMTSYPIDQIFHFQLIHSLKSQIRLITLLSYLVQSDHVTISRFFFPNVSS